MHFFSHKYVSNYSKRDSKDSIFFLIDLLWSQKSSLFLKVTLLHDALFSVILWQLCGSVVQYTTQHRQMFSIITWVPIFTTGWTWGHKPTFWMRGLFIVNKLTHIILKPIEWFQIMNTHLPNLRSCPKRSTICVKAMPPDCGSTAP